MPNYFLISDSNTFTLYPLLILFYFVWTNSFNLQSNSSNYSLRILVFYFNSLIYFYCMSIVFKYSPQSFLLYCRDYFKIEFSSLIFTISLDIFSIFASNTSKSLCYASVINWDYLLNLSNNSFYVSISSLKCPFTLYS